MKKQLRQHNVITEARYEMSALEKNIIYTLMSLMPDEAKETKYEMTLIELERLKGGEIKGRELSRAAKQLVKRTLMIYDGDTKKFLGLKIVSSSKYLKGHLTLEIDKAAIPFFSQLKKNFTTLDLGTAMTLRSVYSKRIYEMLSQYKDTGVLHVSIHEMKSRLGLINSNTGAEKYVEFALFKRYVLEQAQKELAQKSDMGFSYKAVKTGRKFTHLHIKIQDNSRQRLLPTESREWAEEGVSAVRKLIDKYKLSSWQAERIVKQVPLREIGKTTHAIYLEVLNNKVRNIGGYTAKVFAQKYNLDLGFKLSSPVNPPPKQQQVKVPIKPPRQETPSSDQPVANAPDLVSTARGACYRRLILDFGLQVFTVSQIAQQVPLDKLEPFLDDILEEIQVRDVTSAEKAHYVVRRLKEEHKALLKGAINPSSQEAI